MRIGLRHYTLETVDWLKSALGAGGCTRTHLARELREREDWRNAKGELCLGSARAVLPKPSSTLGLPLPAARPMGGVSAASLGYPDKRVSCALADLGTVSVVPVGDGEKFLSRSMLATHHPERDAACPGGRIRYWIRSSSHGILGGLVAGAASWHQKARDDHIGWSQAARDANLGCVVNNDRLLVLPGVRVHGLASRALCLFCDRVGADWEERYGVRPELAYSYVAPSTRAPATVRRAGRAAGSRLRAGRPAAWRGRGGGCM